MTDMHPIFMARGPDFVNKSEPLEPFPNVDLYPLCCHLLQIEPAPNNGSLTIVKTYLGKILDLQAKLLIYNRVNRTFSSTNGFGPTNRHGCLIWRVHHWRRDLCYLFRILEVATSNPYKRSLWPDKCPLRGPLNLALFRNCTFFCPAKNSGLLPYLLLL